MDEIKVLKKVQNIEVKIHEKNLLSEDDRRFFNDWVITDYVSPFCGLGTIQIPGLAFEFSETVPKNAELCHLRYEKPTKSAKSICIKPKTVWAIPVEMRSPLTSMGTAFVYIPNNLNNFQMEMIINREAMLSYTAPYLIRGVWGKQLCSLPQVDNQIKPVLNAYSHQWLTLYKLCINCRDFLSEEELRQILRAWDWLRLLVHEYRRAFLRRLCSDEAQQKTSKVRMFEQLRESVRTLEDGTNLYDPEKQPYMHRLMQICIRLADKADVFREGLWHDYLTSVNTWANEAENSPNILTVSCSKMGGTRRNRQGTGKRKAK